MWVGIFNEDSKTIVDFMSLNCFRPPIFCLVTALFFCACASSQEVQKCSPHKPVQITHVSPEANAVIDEPLITLAANFDFLSGKYPILPDSLRLVLDDVDVTRGARIALTEDVPASSGGISLTLMHPLATGTHTVEVRFSNRKGETGCYWWGFLLNQQSAISN